MASGKSSIGNLMAQKLKYKHIDLDDYIEKKTGQSINELFQTKGEHGFREIEQQLLHEVCKNTYVVISTGGGTPCFFDNCELLLEHGTVIYLNRPLEAILNTLEREYSHRPLIANHKNKEELTHFIKTLHEAREPYYKKAHICIDIQNNSIEEAAKQILLQIEQTKKTK